MAKSAITAKNDSEQATAPGRRGIQSIEVGFRILDVIRKAGRPTPLKDIADACDLTVPNVHYYLVSFQKVGVVQQHADTGHYGLGPYALRLGLAALEQFDVFSSARPIMEEVAAITGHTVFLGVWGNKGPTIVYRVEGARSRPLLELRVGSVLPLLSSALGRNFLAHLPAASTRELLDIEMETPADRYDAQAAHRYTPQEVEAIREEVRKHHISRCRHALLPHFTSLSAPVFDMLGSMTAGITLMGPVGAIDDDLASDTAQLLLEKSRAISRLAGWTEDAAP
ncbi:MULTISPECIES: IclR family transcriptional regulator [Achromobacter]|uniref:Transcriptional repressor IclR n=1 Tax=Achromobacter dolens TaxID=1287738 RepID=A0A6S7EFE3_9BURK|nr:IclR family transcriptional regulator [Achromobacter dolens]MBQ2649671.1 IclR family transcriptional regulator [Achromobacter sp.]OAS85756.1 transcriptional regulator [Achromobacter xylosoxidans]CAB3907871.1 Transcriptional repressor IclR [Achromobacter dolens]CUJ73854.1 Acetate operon repressor [Achromobacter dolens]